MLHTRAPMEYYNDYDDYDSASPRTVPVHSGRENTRSNDAAAMVRGGEGKETVS